MAIIRELAMTSAAVRAGVPELPRYVPSFVDIGSAKGPRPAPLLVHMAEGGNTVAYLAKRNRNGVSVHFVIERNGRITQMLDTDHAHTSIRIRFADGRSAIRTSNDIPRAGFRYGRLAALSRLGSWADTAQSYGPNHATIAVEVEGFAREGMSHVQRSALRTLYLTLVRAGIVKGTSLGHRDFASYKACPGLLVPWYAVGRHASQKV